MKTISYFNLFILKKSDVIFYIFKNTYNVFMSKTLKSIKKEITNLFGRF